MNENTDDEVSDPCTNMYGIADAHGIDYLGWFDNEEDPEFRQHRALMVIRADCNRQRHACYFQIREVDAMHKKVLTALLDKNKPQSALIYIKGVAPESGGVEIIKKHAKSWDMIPNSNIDPYWGGDPDSLIPVKELETMAALTNKRPN